MHRIFSTPVRDVYVHYVAKVERKGQPVENLHTVMSWLTGYDDAQLTAHLDAGTTFAEFFEGASLHPHADQITGSICGVKIAEITDPLMRQIRYLDKLVDEVANGRAMEKVLR